MQRWLFVVAGFCLMALGAPTALAQGNEPERIAYGDFYVSEFTDRAFEHEVVFEGEAGDVIVVDARPNSLDTTISLIDLVLLNEDGANIAQNATVYFTPGSFNILVTTLPEDGEYTLIIGRNGGRASSEIGEFVVELTKAEALTDEPLKQSLNIDTIDNYYLVEGDDELEIVYEQVSGRYLARVIIYEVGADHVLTEVGRLEGTSYAGAALRIAANPDATYIAAVATDFQHDYLQETVDVEYEISLGGA